VPMFPFELLVRDRDRASGAARADLAAVEAVAACVGLLRERREEVADRARRIRLAPEADQLRVIRVPAPGVVDHGLREEGLPPAGDEPRAIEVARVQRPEPHRPRSAAVRIRSTMPRKITPWNGSSAAQ